MLVRKISIFIIIIIIIIELYIHFCVNLEVDSNNFTNTSLKDVKEIIIIMDKKPWYKIKETKDLNFYYINIIKFDEVKFIEWKNIIPEIEYDIHNKLLKIPSKDEERATSIVNLIISNMKGDIEINEIIENDLINKSIIKARKFNVVFFKIKNLVIENNTDNSKKENFNVDNTDIEKELNKIDTFNINNLESKNIESNSESKNIESTESNLESKNIESKNKLIKPEEYNYDGFQNLHYNLFKKDKILRNNLTAGAYGGKQYARPFRY